MSTAMTIADPKTLFERWFGNALAQLEKLSDQDGGTAGMMIVLPLYERYIYIQHKKTGGPFLECMAKDLQLNSRDEADVFWKTFRHGFCHTGMPLERARDGRPLPKPRFSSDFSWRPEFRAEPGIELICLDPWKFIHHVMDKYRSDPALLEQHPDAPLLPIHLFA